MIVTLNAMRDLAKMVSVSGRPTLGGRKVSAKSYTLARYHYYGQPMRVRNILINVTLASKAGYV